MDCPMPYKEMMGSVDPPAPFSETEEPETEISGETEEQMPELEYPSDADTEEMEIEDAPTPDEEVENKTDQLQLLLDRFRSYFDNEVLIAAAIVLLAILFLYWRQQGGRIGIMGL